MRCDAPALLRPLLLLRGVILQWASEKDCRSHIRKTNKNDCPTNLTRNTMGTEEELTFLGESPGEVTTFTPRASIRFCQCGSVSVRAITAQPVPIEEIHWSWS